METKTVPSTMLGHPVLGSWGSEEQPGRSEGARRVYRGLEKGHWGGGEERLRSPSEADREFAHGASNVADAGDLQKSSCDWLGGESLMGVGFREERRGEESESGYFHGQGGRENWDGAGRGSRAGTRLTWVWFGFEMGE